MNQINAIRPYIHFGLWVFDDQAKELEKEALVAGTDKILDILCHRHNLTPGNFTIIFSKDPFPGYQHCFRHISEDQFGGNWYSGDIDNVEYKGWLCPALFKYFTNPPANLYIQLKAINDK